MRIGKVCATESSRQQMESGDISADGTLILEGLVLLALVPSTSDKSSVSRLPELQRAL